MIPVGARVTVGWGAHHWDNFTGERIPLPELAGRAGAVVGDPDGDGDVPVLLDGPQGVDRSAWLNVTCLTVGGDGRG